jgi:hypothetical protein
VTRSKTLFAYPVDETAEGYLGTQRFAATVEQLTQLKEPVLVEALRELVGSDVSEIGYWAVKTLREKHPAGLDAFLQQTLAHDSLTLRAQLAIDETLLDMQGQQWHEAVDRRQLMTRWANAHLKDEDSEQLRYWLVACVNRRDNLRLDGTRVIELAQTALENKTLAITHRKVFVTLLECELNGNPANTAAKRLLIHLVKGRDETVLRLTAARILTGPILQADPEHRREIEGLLESVEDPQVVEVLRQALAKTKE